MSRKLQALNRNEIKEYILSLQLEVKEQISNQNSIDDFLDKTDIFDEFEEILSDQEFGILILTILNNFIKSIQNPSNFELKWQLLLKINF